MLFLMVFAGFLATAVAATSTGPATESYKGQYCTDPRTMLKHPAYTEWADAYSCTRHRCQPGGRNLAIYTVGCKRVEAPESAIECEEVVEDTNMQFPFCCTRLRCLVVVRGEVWTRVLGQPWETLPAAPWSHMYKMKRPPPGSGDTFAMPKAPKTSEGPIYELAKPEEDSDDKVLRSGKKNEDCNSANEIAPRAAPAPDIVIALSTNNDPMKEPKKKSDSRRKRGRKHVSPYLEEDTDPSNDDLDDNVMRADKEKPLDPQSDERDRYAANSYGVTQKIQSHQQVAWTEPPAGVEPAPEVEPVQRAEDKPEEKSGNLQALVDAIGSRMRDIEHVVRRMSDKVHNEGDEPKASSSETAQAQQSEPEPAHKRRKVKKSNPDGEHYKRFTERRSSKYLSAATEASTEPPLFVEDSHLGYFSDASNTVLRRAPKLRGPRVRLPFKTPYQNRTKTAEPSQTYMAPVESHRRSHLTMSDASEEEKKRKKHSHKKKKFKGHHKKHRSKDDKRKRFNRVNSVELDKNAVSLEDSSAGAAAST